MKLTERKLAKWIRDLEPFVVRERRPIEVWRGREGEVPGAQAPDFDDGDWDLMQVGDRWGGRDVTLWLRATVSVPEEWRDSPVALELQLSETGAEGLLYLNGVATHGLDRNHTRLVLSEEHKTALSLCLAIQAWSGLGGETHQLARLDLLRLDPAAEDLLFTARVAYDVAQQLPSGALLRLHLWAALDEAFVQVNWRRPGSEEFYASLAAARQVLQERLTALRETQGEDLRPTVIGVGHAHIDVAWLWRLKHTREKARRTFATALYLMEQYPEYVFLQSQPQLYQFIKEDDPELYERIKAAIKRGNWEATGGMWLEADCNVPSGESLVRQFLFGTRFLRREFGLECRVLWLPDVFGYTWVLPQLIKRSGLKYFMTTKISWNQYNPLPYDTFRWRGLDGTEVLTHFVTTPTPGFSPESWFATYNGMITAEVVQGTWSRYRQQALSDEVLHSYGFGDGGGGPTREMLEYARRLAQGPAPVRFQLGGAEGFFARLEERLAGNEEVPVWDGELYLEYHRGTYTSQARNKRLNRKCEVLYHNAELFSAVAALLEGPAYPQADLNRGWELILRNQFHDILPGSSIPEVYQDSAAEYATVQELGQRALDGALEYLTRQMVLAREAVIVFNPCSWPRTEVVEVPFEGEAERVQLRAPDGKLQRPQVVTEGEVTKLVFTVEEAPPLGYRAYELVPLTPEAETEEGVYGPLQRLLQDPDVTRITVSGPQQTFVTRRGRLDRAVEQFRTEEEIRLAAERLVAALGGTLDEDHPEFDLRLPDGSRVRVMIPPLAVRGTNITIQKESANLWAQLEIAKEEVSPVTPADLASELIVTPQRLENRFFTLTLDEHGHLTSVYDKRAGREVLAPGARGNVLQVFEDRPLAHDAWDIDLFYQQKREEVTDLESAEVAETGPERGVLLLTWRYGDSTIRQRLTIYRAVPRIDFVTEVDWQERQRLLKVAFPVDVRATKATFDIQFGNLERPTHWNTSWDWAKFETCAHKWADLSEGGYGVSLLNDCKYGHDVKDNVLRLTLLKSAIHPDPEADRGRHEFTYSLYPHREDWWHGGTVQQAYALNYPLIVRQEPAHPGLFPDERSFAQVDAEHVVLETIKQAEDEDCWVVRLYETARRRGAVTVTFFQEIHRAVECNLVEEGEEPVETEGNCLRLDIKPYEIRTFKVWLR